MNFGTIRDVYFDDDSDKLEYFIRNCGYDVNYNELWSRNSSNIPILRACRTKALKCLRVLLKHGAEINREIEIVPDFFNSLFNVVVEENQYGSPNEMEIIKLLLDYGANINFSSYLDYLYSFSEYFSTRNMSHKVVQLLLMYGLKYNNNFINYTFLLIDPKTVRLCYDWPNLVTLYCLEKRNKFFIF